MISGIIVGVIFLFIPLSTQALAVNPSKIDVTIEPASQKETLFSVFNNTDSEIIVSLRTQAFQAGDQQGVPEFIDRQPHQAWLQLPKEPITLEPGKAKDIILPIIIPADALPGSYMVAVFASQKSETADTATQITYNNDVGVLYFINVSGNYISELNILETHVRSRNLGDTAFTFEALLENSGTVFQEPEGTIHITNVFSDEYIKAPFNAEKNRILPNSSRALETKISTVSIWHHVLNPLRFGIYEVDLEIDGHDTQQQTLRVFVWSPTGIVLLVTGLFMLRRRRHHKKIA